MSVVHNVGSVDSKRSVTCFQGIRGDISVTNTLKFIYYFNKRNNVLLKVTVESLKREIYFE